MGPPSLLAHTSLSFRCKCWAVRMAPSGPQMWLQRPQKQLPKQPRPHHLTTPSPGVNLPSSCSINKASCSSVSGLSLSTLRDTTTHLQTHTCGVACSEHTRICDSTQGRPANPSKVDRTRQADGRMQGGLQRQQREAASGTQSREGKEPQREEVVGLGARTCAQAHTTDTVARVRG